MNFLGAQFLRHFPRGHDFGGGPVGPFRATYTCYSAAFLHDSDRGRLNVENGGKILLPQAALEQLVDQVNDILLLYINDFYLIIHLSLDRCYVI